MHVYQGFDPLYNGFMIGGEDPDGNSSLLSYSMDFNSPQHGNVLDHPGSTNSVIFIYEPDAGYVGEDVINFTVTDSAGGSDVGVITVIIHPEDADGDGIPNSVEDVWGMNHLDPSDAFLDQDADGLSALQEFELGTDPFLADTDTDGMPDMYEAGYVFLNPLDPSDAVLDFDGDGFSNFAEFEAGTNPDNAAINPDQNIIAWLVPVLGLLLN